MTAPGRGSDNVGFSQVQSPKSVLRLPAELLCPLTGWRYELDGRVRIRFLWFRRHMCVRWCVFCVNSTTKSRRAICRQAATTLGRPPAVGPAGAAGEADCVLPQAAKSISRKHAVISCELTGYAQSSAEFSVTCELPPPHTHTLQKRPTLGESQG